MALTKEQVQQRVLQNGMPLAFDKFSWDEKTNTFSSAECYLVIDFGDWENCTFDTGENCTFKTGWGCTFDTGWNCTFDTGWNCTFDTGGGCTFDTGGGCTFKTGGECVIVNRNVFEAIQPKEGDIIQICPAGIPGHLVNGMYNGKPHIIADGILSEIVSQRGNVFRVINYGKEKQSYLIKAGDVYSHGATLKQAKESLIYKISDRDTSKYESMTLDSIVTFAEAVAMYRTITGACAEGCMYFVEQNKDKKKDKYTIAEIIELTEGQYNSDMLVDFFKKG